MKYLQGQNRTQTNLFPVSLDDSIDQDNEVCLIGMFVNSLKLSDYGFAVNFRSLDNLGGRPAYHPGDLLKLYLYGYLNKVRSSRDLEKEAYYKRRQAIVEHPFGTIKRQWGFSYILTKNGIERASAYIGFMLTAYNLRRIINIIGIEQFTEYLKTVVSLIQNIIRLIKLKRANLKVLHFHLEDYRTVFKDVVKRLYLTQ